MAKQRITKNKDRKLTFTVLGRKLMEFFRNEEAKPLVSNKYL